MASGCQDKKNDPQACQVEEIMGYMVGRPLRSIVAKNLEHPCCLPLLKRHWVQVKKSLSLRGNQWELA